MTERYMVTAVPVDGGERVTGYLFKTWLSDGSFKWVIQSENKTHKGTRLFETDPATIEPVKASVLKDMGSAWCPNCDEWIDDTLTEPGYCPHCGQALDWSEEHNIAEPNRTNGESEQI